jgi:hypothetical protein
MLADWPDQFDKVASAVGSGNTTMIAQMVPSYINAKGILVNNIDPSGRQTGSRAGFTIVIVMSSLLGLITIMMFIRHGFSNQPSKLHVKCTHSAASGPHEVVKTPESQQRTEERYLLQTMSSQNKISTLRVGIAQALACKSLKVRLVDGREVRPHPVRSTELTRKPGAAAELGVEEAEDTGGRVQDRASNGVAGRLRDSVNGVLFSISKRPNYLKVLF